MDLGASTVTFRAAAGSTALVVAPAVRVERDRVRLEGAAAFGLFPSGARGGQATLALSRFTAPQAGAQAELALTATGAAYEPGTGSRVFDRLRAGAAGAQLRGHWLLGRGGFYGGLGGGFDRRRDDAGMLLSAAAGAWLRAGDALLGTSLSSDFISCDARVATMEADCRDRSVDAAASAEWVHAGYSLSGSIGMRRSQLVATRPWGTVALVLPLNAWLATVVSAGVAPADPVLGTERSRYLMLALRVGPSRRAATTPAPAAEPPVAVLATAARGERLLRIRIHAERRVEIAADFTGWAPVAMRRAGTDIWEAALAIAPGVHRLSVRVDDGAWRAAPGLAPAADDYGGEAGVLLVP